MNNLNYTEKTKKHFDDIASNYANSSDGKFCKAAYDSIIAELEKFKSGKWLDVSCGPGTVLSMLSDSPLDKYGIDFSEKMIDEARNNVGDNTHLYVASAEELPFEDNAMDIVTCSFAFHHYIHPATVLHEFRRVMKKGASLAIVDPYLPQPLRFIINPLLRFSNNGDFHMYGRKELNKLMREHGFELENFKCIDKKYFFCQCKAV